MPKTTIIKTALRFGNRAQLKFDNNWMVDIDTTNVKTCQVNIVSSELIPNQPH